MTTLLDNRYHVLQVLGAGGFGTTFLAEDTQMPSKRKCVIKQLKPITNNPEVYRLVQERFQREAATLEELGEECNQIPRLHAYFSQDDQFFLVQEWIEGSTLRQRIQDTGPLSETNAKEILQSLLSVLNFVHDKRIVHRDIKPDNIMLRQRDGTPILIDFGAVKETMGTVVTSHGGTGSSIVIGTPGFMPSEQAAGRPLYSSDLYSLSLTVIYLLTGRVPSELELDSRTGDLIWQEHAPHIDPGFAAVLDKAIQYHPRDRYATVQEMLAALHSIDAPTTLPDPSSNVQPVTSSQSVTPPISGIPPTLVSQAEASTTDPPPTIVNSEVISPLGLATAKGDAQPSHRLANTPPDEIIGWNWGAFLLPGFWCLGSHVWLGLLAWSGVLTGGIGWLAAGILLGVKGNEWAWKSRRWQSVQSFKAHQRTWAIAGLTTYGGFTLLMMLLLIVAIFIPTPSNPSKPDATSSPTPKESPQ